MLPHHYLTSLPVRPYVLGMTTTNITWKYQHDTATELHYGTPTDARGLKLRRDCGYTHVYMGQGDGCYDGWLQINVAIAKLEIRERIALLRAAVAQLGA